MKKRTMQEWADFTGCYISKDELGNLYANANKPVLKVARETFDKHLWFFGNCVSFKDLVKDYKNHDFHILVEPRQEGA